MTEIAMVT